MTFDAFETHEDPVLRKMRKAGERYAAAILARQQPFWLTLYGRAGSGNGTGKTYLSRMILDRVRRHQWGTTPTKFLDWPGTARKFQSQEDITGRMAFAREADVLVIDDAGAEHRTPATIGLLYTLLNHRLGKWTIVTTNLSPSDWAEADTRIASRLRRGGSFILECETTDYALRKT